MPTKKLQIVGAKLKGEDGKTPVRGVDYWTEEDKKEITDYVDKEISEFDFVKVVDTLPETGLVNREYFVRKAKPDTNDLFDEWAWINKGTEENPDYGWEFKGTKKFEVELTDFVKFTDYASTSKVGVLKIGGTSYGLYIGNNGVLTLSPASREDISAKTQVYKPLSPRHLDYAFKVAATDNKEEWTEDTTDENGELVKGDKTKARELIGAVGFKDYATDEVAGVARLIATFGLTIDKYGRAQIVKAEKADIDNGTQEYKPITPKLLKYAVKVGVTTNTETLTDEEKTSACEWLGATPIPKVGAENGSFTIVKPDGTTSTIIVAFSNYPMPNRVPVYTENKTIMVNAPVLDTDAANKKYADDLIASVNALNGYQITIIKGDYTIKFEYAGFKLPTKASFLEKVLTSLSTYRHVSNGRAFKVDSSQSPATMQAHYLVKQIVSFSDSFAFRLTDYTVGTIALAETTVSFTVEEFNSDDVSYRCDALAKFL